MNKDIINKNIPSFKTQLYNTTYNLTSKIKILNELPKIDYHLQILHFIHHCSCSNNTFNMSWPISDNFILYFVRHHNINIKDKWYYKYKYTYNTITNIQQFINENTTNFEKYIANYQITNDLIKQLQPILGEYYLTFIEIGWCLSISKKNYTDYKVFLKIVIDRFNVTNINVTFNNITTIYNHITLIEFINKHLDNITSFKQDIVKYNLNTQILNKENKKQAKIQLNIEKDFNNSQLDEKLSQYNNTIKKTHPSSLFINTTKKDFIETITCKPYNTNLY